MILISHRGNLNGPQPENENRPDYIEKALLNYNVEIDIFFYKNELWLGHDNPQYKIKNLNWLENNKLWCHAKNLEALDKMLKYPKIHCFWHQNDDYTITSKGYIWAYPGKKLNKNAIYVLPEWCKKFDTTLKYCGVCSDYMEKYRKKILTLKKK